jgi:hypothetical protein
MTGKGCKVRGCSEKHAAKGYCLKHYSQWRYHGHVKKRVTTDPNNFIFNDDVCIIETFDRQGRKNGEAIVDTEDYEIIKDRKWHIRKDKTSKYVVSGYRENFVRLAWVIMNAKKGQIVDHKDRNTLNNRKGNLRLCTKMQNVQNASKRISNKSGIKNVWWDKGDKKWFVNITSNKIRHYIGRFNSIKEAEIAAVAARAKYHGEFACA